MPSLSQITLRLKATALEQIYHAVSVTISRLRLMALAVEGRRCLARMDERMLSDIGISPGQAQHEMARLPWDISSSDASR